MNRLPDLAFRRLPQFKVETIDERIRRSNMSLIAKAFWKHGIMRRAMGGDSLHPNYVCWFNSCENLATWTIDPAITASVDTIDKQEAGGSTQLSRLTSVTGDKYSYPTSQNICDIYFGFWLQVVYPGQLFDGGDVMKRNTVEGSYQTAQWRYKDTTTFNLYQVTFNGTNLTSTLSPAFVYNLDTWYWIELLHSPPSSSYLRVNGVLLSTIGHTINLTANLRLEHRVENALVLGTCKIDYMRLANQYEYPPA